MDRSSEILVLFPLASTQAELDSTRRQAQALIAEIVQGNDHNDDSSSILQTTSQEDQISWHISNKYYDANVHFRISSLSFGVSKKSIPLRRKAILRDEAAQTHPKEGQFTSLRPHEEDEELKRRVRDVFEALQQPYTPIEPRLSKGAFHDKSVALADETRGVDAIMMVVDSNKTLHQHKALLDRLKMMDDDDKAALSGFDLGISLVVAMPSSLEVASKHDGVSASTEQLVEVYAAGGWEYIDLEAQMDSFADLDEGSSGEEGISQGEEGEKRGTERIREALETHAWPGLIRKNDGQMRGPVGEVASTKYNITPSNDDIEGAMAAIDINDYRASEDYPSAEPTEQDEALAKAFLKSILESQLAASSSQADEIREEKPMRSLQEMQQELEAFLESEDSHWPVENSAPPSQNEAKSNSAWPEPEAGSSVVNMKAFDDDFSDFVSGGGYKDVRVATSGTVNEEGDIFGEDADLDLDDIALMKALDSEAVKQRFPLAGEDTINANFESTLSVIVAQAERVRSIKDVEKRRQEAARIALAMVQGQPP